MIRRSLNGVLFTLQHDDFSKYMEIVFSTVNCNTRVILNIANGSINVRIIRQYRYLNRDMLEDKTISYYDKKVYKQLSKAFDLLANRLALKR